jgi:hypothetical protein
MTARDLNPAIDAIYEAALEPGLWPQALREIADYFEDTGALLIWRRDDGRYGTIASPSLIDAQREYEAHWQHLDVRAERGFQQSYLTVANGMTDLDIVTPEEMASLPI